MSSILHSHYHIQGYPASSQDEYSLNASAQHNPPVYSAYIPHQDPDPFPPLHDTMSPPHHIAHQQFAPLPHPPQYGVPLKHDAFAEGFFASPNMVGGVIGGPSTCREHFFPLSGLGDPAGIPGRLAVGGEFGPGMGYVDQGLVGPGVATKERTVRAKGHVLHRNKACLSCRSRKTKCDAAKPVCSSCKKLGVETDCQYDQPPKWLEAVTRGARQAKARVAANSGKVSDGERGRAAEEMTVRESDVVDALERKLEALEEQLKELRVSAATNAAKADRGEELVIVQRGLEQKNMSNGSEDLVTSGLGLASGSGSSEGALMIPLAGVPTKPGPSSSGSAMVGPVLVRNADGTYDRFATWANGEHQHSSPPESASSDSSSSQPNHMMSLQLQYRSPILTALPRDLPPEPNEGLALSEPHWPRTLPPRQTCKLLAKAFFSRPLVPYLPMNAGKLLARLTLSPTHPLFPQASLIHAIGAVGSMELSMGALGRPYWGKSAGGPAEYHSKWAATVMWDALMKEKDSKVLFEHAQAAVTIGQYYHTKGMALDLWVSLGYCIRICTMLGIHKYNPQQAVSQKRVAAQFDRSIIVGSGTWEDGVDDIGSTADPVDAYDITVLWWHVYACERTCAAVSGFSVSISEEDVSAPIMSTHSHVPTFECHSIQSESFWECHEEDSLASLQLLVKASVLLGKVSTYLQRSNHPAVPLQQAAVEREVLWNNIQRFITSFPERFSMPIRFDKMGRIDSCLLSAHTVVHATIIHLYEDAAQLSLSCPALAACANSAQVLMDLLHHVVNRNIEIGQLLCANPCISFPLILGLRTQVRVLAVHDALGYHDVAQHMREECEAVVRRLRESTHLPMAGRNLMVIEELLKDPTVCLPTRHDIKQKNSFVRSLGKGNGSQR